MRALLDTNALLWWLEDNVRLGSRARELIADSRNEVFVSAASVWEIAIKSAIGKLRTPGDLPRQILRHRMTHLPISAAHAMATLTLPPHHKDPFDRMIIAQARLEGLMIVTSDSVFGMYPVEVVET